MRRFKIKNNKLCFAILFAVVLILLPMHPAKAEGCSFLSSNPITECILEGTNYFVFLLFTLVGNGIAGLVGILYSVINIPVYPDGGIAVIDESWKIMRNFANMFFIVALILMAFATIFDVLPGAAKYNARALFGRFLLTALLINFSLVIGVLVIQGTQVLSNTFLIAMGDISNQLGQKLNPSLLIPKLTSTTEYAQAVEQGVFKSLISLTFAVVLGATFLFSLLTAVIFAFIRIPILWALLVVSPIAWILNIFPSGQGTFSKWWKTFIGWNMFLPIFLFFLYFGLYFLGQQDVVMNAIAKQVKNQNIGEGVPFTFQILFMYIMARIFLIGGTIVAMKASMFSGTGVVGIAKWSRGVASRRLGLTAIGGAAQQKIEQVQKEGLPTKFGQAIFGGQRALDLETARRARQFGVKGALEKGVEIEKEKQKPFANNVAELRRLAAGGSREQMLAARSRLAELGDKEFLSFDRIQETHRMAGGERSELANKIMSSIDSNKLDTVTRQKLSSWTVFKNNVELFKKNAMAMIEKDKLDESEIESLAKQFVNDADVKDFLDKGIKKNLLAVAKTRIRMGIEGASAVDKEMEKAFGKMNNDQILEFMNDPTFRTMLEGIKERKRRGELPTDDDKILDAMNNTLGKNPKKLATLIPQSSGSTQRTLEAMAKLARRKQNLPKITAFRKSEQDLVPQIDQARIDLDTIEKQIKGMENQIKLNPPTASINTNLQSVITQLEKKRVAKEGEVRSLSDKRDKINEKIDNLKKGGVPPPTP